MLAGPEAIFVAGRVAADAPTVVRIGPSGGEGDLVCAYAGDLATPGYVLRLVTVSDDVLAEVPVDEAVLRLEIFLKDLEEPDEIYVALGAR